MSSPRDWPTRLKTAVGVLTLFLAASALNSFLDVNFQALYQDAKADRLIADAAPSAWRWAGRTLELFYGLMSAATGPFGLGFAAGAALFSIPDIPALTRWIVKRRAEKKRPKRDIADDQKLASQCDEIAKELFEEGAALERLKQEYFWREVKDGDSRSGLWNEERVAQAKEVQRIKARILPKISKAMHGIQKREIRINTWHMSLDQYGMAPAAFFFGEIAEDLRTGEYIEKMYTVDHYRMPRL